MSLSNRRIFRRDLVRNLLNKAERARIPLSIKTPLVFSLHHDLQVQFISVETMLKQTFRSFKKA